MQHNRLAQSLKEYSIGFLLCIAITALPLKYSVAAEEKQPVSKAHKTANKALNLSRQHDQNRPKNQFQLRLAGRPLTIGGEFSFETEYRDNFRLDDDNESDEWELELELELEFLYQWNESLIGFAELEFEHENELYREDGNEDNETFVRRGQTWLFYNKTPVSPVSIQFGRQSFREEHEWWWDQSLDAIRIHYDNNYLHGEISIAEDIFRITTADDLSADDEDILRILSQLRWDWDADHSVSLYAVHQHDHSGTPGQNQIVSQDDEDEVDTELTWLGVGASGHLQSSLTDKLYYRANLAYVSGSLIDIDFDDISGNQSIVDEVNELDVSGWALDLSLTMQTNWTQKPWVTFGLAYGSGEDGSGTTDNNFRATGLEDYEGKFRGVNRFHYYGEVLQPDLSNIQITTLALGYPILDDSSVEFLIHHYRQVHASDSNRIGRIRSRLNGIDKEIGQAVEVVFGFEESEHHEIELIAGVFQPGDAFDDDNTAYSIMLQIDYNF